MTDSPSGTPSTAEIEALTVDLTRQLIAAKSISPDDAGCQDLIATELSKLGFTITKMPYADTDNLWACYGEGPPYLVFAGHTDVVPAGPSDDWQTDPFVPTEIDGKLYGRGSADMKGSLAAMIAASKMFLSDTKPKGSLAFLITSDEEADATHGTRKVIQALVDQGIKPDWCLIGEPSSSEHLGDVVRVGRRGSLHAKLKVNGIQGHVAYPDKAKNPIHNAMAALDALSGQTWDQGNEYFPPTSMQISNIHAGTGVTNVIPGELNALINFRFSTESNEASLKQRTHAIFDQYSESHGLNYEIEWELSGNPFLTTGGELIPAVQASVRKVCGIETELSTSGGTSDGRFIAPHGIQVVELGPNNNRIHKVDEYIDINELHHLTRLYEDIIRSLLGSHP